MLLSGCAPVTPFIDVGAGYTIESGEYWGDPYTPLDETGLTGRWSAGVEFIDRWYLPSWCAVDHNSQFSRKPEISLYRYECIKRLRFGRAESR